jgi:stress response protein YsnF
LREVAIGKRVETKTARVFIPTEKERVVIESITPENAGAPVTPDTAFKQEKVMRMEVYEETAEIKKQAFVREKE